MSAGPAPRPGAVVAWWDRNALAFGVVGTVEQERVRLVLVRGKEEQVKVSRIVAEVAPPGAVPGGNLADRQAAGLRAAEAEARARHRAAEVEVAVVWDIVREGREASPDGLPCDSGQLSELALGAPDGAAMAALILALIDDGIHFYRKADAWVARPPKVVQDLKLERERVARREADTQMFFGDLRALCRGEPFELRHSAVEQRFLHALERLAVEQDGTPVSESRTALEALSASGLRWERPHEGAFRLLRRIGRFRSDDENLQPLRFGLRTAFPPEVREAAAHSAAAGFGREHRRDLTLLEALSIDDAHTREIDDLISCEPRAGGAWRLGVHIADPGAFVEPGTALDDEALTRSLTYYMPDLRLPMLPPEISEHAASLLPGEERPALSFLIDLDAAGEVERFELCPSVVRSAGRLDYRSADLVLAGGRGEFGSLLAHLGTVASLRQAARQRSGAILLHAPEIDLHVSAEGVIELARLPGRSPARLVVSEAMILAGEVAARFCIRAGLPVIYRRQPPPSTPLDLPADGVGDAVELRRARMALRRAEVGLEPGPHHSLGLPAYAQVTSPIRRYQDLASHRQILAALGTGRPAHDLEAMQRILASTEAAEQSARRAERAAVEYWTLRYLEGQRGCTLDARVVQLEPRPVIQLDETLWEQGMSALTGVELGQRIRVRVERVNPRAGILDLRGVEPSSGK